MKIRVWEGCHSRELLARIKNAWQGDELLILCPPSATHFVQGLERFSEGKFPDRPVLGVFTSGTVSGTPRLVLYSKKNVEASLNGILGSFEPERITSIFCYPQPFHTFGLLLGYVLALKLEVPLHSPDGRYTRSAHELRVEMQEPGLLTLGTPTHFFDLINYLDFSRQEIADSYSCIIGGAPVSPSLWRAVRDRLRIEAPSIGYGCTEASPGITHLAAGREPKETGEIGHPLPCIGARIARGEGVWIEGDSLCLAIVERGKIEFPSRLLIKDEVEVKADGTWLFRGRIDLVLNRGGTKHALESIERAIFERVQVPIVATSLPDRRLGEDLALAIKGSDFSGELIEAVRKLLEQSCGIRLKESHVFLFDELPLNAAAKIDRKSILASCSNRLDRLFMTEQISKPEDLQ